MKKQKREEAPVEEKDSEKPEKEKKGNATQQLLQKTAKWKKGIEEDEEGKKAKEAGDNTESSAEEECKDPMSEAESSSAEEEARDKGKGIRWKKMMDQGAIPEHIVEMFEKEAKKHKSPRAYKTKLINELFEKNPVTGRYEMAAHKPLFENFKQASSTKFGTQLVKGQPRSVFLYSHFHGDENGLERAIALGDVRCWQQNGSEWCGFEETSAGTKKKNTVGHKLSGGEVDLTEEQFKVANKSFNKMVWNFDQSALGNSASHQEKPQERQLKKLEEGFTPKMAQMVSEAKQSEEKLLGQAMKLLGKAPVEETRDVKLVIVKLKEMISTLEHVELFKAGNSDSLLFFSCAYFSIVPGAARFLFSDQSPVPRLHDPNCQWHNQCHGTV